MANLTDKALGTLIRVQEGSENVNYELAGFNVHGAGSATLVRKHVQTQTATRRMHNAYINYYGQTEMDTYLNNTLYNTFPAKLRKFIQTAPITCFFVPDQSEVLQRKCFLLSNTEIGLPIFGFPSGENSPLGLYSIAERRQKTNGSSPFGVSWWLRSRFLTNTGYYGIVNAQGTSVDSITAVDYATVAPAFVLPSNRPLWDEPNADGSYNLSYAEYIDIDVPLGSLTDMPKAIRTMLQYQGQITSLYACNNYNDSAPTWEAILDNAEHAFANTTKTAGQWAVAVRVTIEREAAEEICLNEFPAIVRC